ncbi:MAG: hypothetical protein IT436_14075 [Phycisphaerales bacterium]|nr:hypothetical protein [Phycisphaerales bacterium]
MDLLTGNGWLDFAMLSTGVLGGVLVLFGRWVRRAWIGGAGIVIAWLGLGPATLMATGVIEPGIYWRSISTPTLIQCIDGSVSMREYRALGLLVERVASDQLSDAEFESLLARVGSVLGGVVGGQNQKPGFDEIMRLLDDGRMPQRRIAATVDLMLRTVASRRSTRQGSYSSDDSRVPRLAADPRITAQQRAALLNMMLAALEDPANAPPNPWTRALAELIADGKMDQAGIDRYFAAATNVELEMRTPGGGQWRGDVIPVYVKGNVDEQTFPFSPTLPWRGEVKLRPGSMEFVRGTQSLPIWRDRGQGGGQGGDQPLGYIKLPDDPGEYELVADVTVDLTTEMRRESLAMNPRYRRPGMNLTTLPDIHISHPLTLKVKVGDQRAADVPGFRGEEAQRAVIESLRFNQLVRVTPKDGAFFVGIPFSVDDPPAGISMLAFWEVDGTQYPLGRLLALPGVSRFTGVNGLVQDGEGQPYLVLRPDPEFLRHARSVERVYEGPEIRFPVNGYLH